MNIIKIIDIILIILLIIIGIETLLKVKNSEGKLIEDVRKPLIIRIDIIMILTIIIAILLILNIIIK